MAKQLTHLRYIVYRDSAHQKQVLIWQDGPIHADYARANNIPITDFCAGGYLGVADNQWLIYEDYPVAEDGQYAQEFNKKLVMATLKSRPEYTDEGLKIKLTETYRQEKHLLLYAIKRLFDKSNSPS